MPTSKQNPGGQIAARIVDCLHERAGKARVVEVRIGLGYTAVLLDDNQLGVAYTFHDEAVGGCSVFRGIRPLANRLAADLLVLLESSDPIEAGVGLACANALANRSGTGMQAGDILERISLRPEDHVGMVGHFGPLVTTIQERAATLTVFERIDLPAGLLRPTAEAFDILPHCQVALITATSIINHTIDRLLQAASHCREIVVLGASTPLLPAAFGEKEVTLLSGVLVKDPPAVLQVVSEGGGMRQFSPFVQKVSLPAKIADLYH